MTTTLDDLVNEVRSTLRGYGLGQDVATFMTADGMDDDFNFTVTEPEKVMPGGVVEVGSELMWVQSVDASTGLVTVSPDGRGWLGTTQRSAEDIGSSHRVTVNPAYTRQRVVWAINATITGAYPAVFGVGTTSFTFNPAQSSYALPAEAERVLAVVADTIGPSRDQVQLRRYSVQLNSSAAGDFPTTNSIRLGEAPDPGRTVTVTYAKRPVSLADGEALSVSGLAESGRQMAVYGALATLLAGVDASRALASSSNTFQMSPYNDTGVATNIAAQMTARYQMELDGERRRLEALYPPRLVWGR